MAKVELDIDYGVLYVPESYRAPDSPPNLELTKRMTFSHLMNAISEDQNLPEAEPILEEHEVISPENIDRGLCIGTNEARMLALSRTYIGIGFTATQFLSIARSPRDLASHTYQKTKSANEKRPPEERMGRQEAEETAQRSAGHALESYAQKAETVIGQLAQQRRILLALHKELKAPGRAHYLGINLDKIRKIASDIIHSDVEVAAVNFAWTSELTDRVQRLIHFKLYGQRGHGNARMGAWAQYVLMAGTHTGRQLTATGEARRRTHRELERYKPYLEAARQQ